MSAKEVGAEVAKVEVRTPRRWASIQLGPREGQQAVEDTAWGVTLPLTTPVLQVSVSSCKKMGIIIVPAWVRYLKQCRRGNM